MKSSNDNKKVSGNAEPSGQEKDPSRRIADNTKVQRVVRTTTEKRTAAASNSVPLKSKTVKETESLARYRTRIIKGSFLPLLYAFISYLMLRNYVSEFNENYSYILPVIIGGFILGILTMSGSTSYILYRVKNKKTKKIRINSIVAIFVIAPVLLMVIALAIVWGISTAWQFSIGYFASAIFPPIIVGITEALVKAKFYVKDIGSPKKATDLILIKNLPE